MLTVGCPPLCVRPPQVKAHVYVEIGRVVVINYGELAGKVAVIVDVVDQARVSTNRGREDNQEGKREREREAVTERDVAADAFSSLLLCCARRLLSTIESTFLLALLDWIIGYNGDGGGPWDGCCCCYTPSTLLHLSPPRLALLLPRSSLALGSTSEFAHRRL